MNTKEICVYLDSLGEDCVTYKKDLVLSAVSSFRIGGRAAVAAYPRGKQVFCDIVSELKRRGVKYCVIGNASNILFSDAGYDGVLIFTGSLCGCSADGCRVYAEAGVTLPALSALLLRSSLTGLEFAYGIPGTVGGAVFMNAGAYAGSFSDVVESAELYDAEHGDVVRLSAEEMKFSYRKSVCMERELYVLSVILKLETGDAAQIRSAMEDYISRRKEKQPLEWPSAGSVFKRPEGDFAGRLIEVCGLTGYPVGGAQISEKHAGFIINRGGASAADILALIEHIRKTVFENTGVMLECEIRYIE